MVTDKSPEQRNSNTDQVWVSWEVQTLPIVDLVKDCAASLSDLGADSSGQKQSMQLPLHFPLELLHKKQQKEYLLYKLRSHESFCKDYQNIDLLQRLYRKWILLYEEMEAVLMEQMDANFQSVPLFVAEIWQIPSDFHKGEANMILQKLGIAKR